MFDAAVDVKGPGRADVELHCPFHVCVEGFDHALQFWWAASLWKDLEVTVPADKIKRLACLGTNNDNVNVWPQVSTQTLSS